MNDMRAKLRVKKEPHLKDRDIKMPIETAIMNRKTARSMGFPSAMASDEVVFGLPIHCEGSRDATINIQITGAHKASEVRGSLAGSKINNPTKRISQRVSATEGDIFFDVFEVQSHPQNICRATAAMLVGSYRRLRDLIPYFVWNEQVRRFSHTFCGTGCP